VPVIVDGDRWVADSWTIANYPRTRFRIVLCCSVVQPRGSSAGSTRALRLARFRHLPVRRTRHSSRVHEKIATISAKAARSASARRLSLHATRDDRLKAFRASLTPLRLPSRRNHSSEASGRFMPTTRCSARSSGRAPSVRSSCSRRAIRSDLARPPARWFDGLAVRTGYAPDSADAASAERATPSSKGLVGLRARAPDAEQTLSSKRATSLARTSRERSVSLGRPDRPVEERFDLAQALGDDRTELASCGATSSAELMRKQPRRSRSPTERATMSSKSSGSRAWAAAFPRTARCGPRRGIEIMLQRPRTDHACRRRVVETGPRDPIDVARSPHRCRLIPAPPEAVDRGLQGNRLIELARLAFYGPWCR